MNSADITVVTEAMFVQLNISFVEAEVAIKGSKNHMEWLHNCQVIGSESD